MPAVSAEEKKSVGRPCIAAWSIQSPSCKSCGTSDKTDRNKKHHAQGYCFRCYHREWAGHQPTLANRTKIKDAESVLDRECRRELAALREMYLCYAGNEGATAVAQLICKVEEARHGVNRAKRDLAVLKKEAANGGN